MSVGPDKALQPVKVLYLLAEMWLNAKFPSGEVLDKIEFG